MSTTFNCPHCSFAWPTGGTFVDAAFANNGGMNVAVDCPRCHRTFEGAPGGDGIYSTVGGQLRRVADFIAEAGPEGARRIQGRAEAVRQDRDGAAAVALLTELGWRPPSTTRSRLETANLALDLIEKLIRILGILLVAGGWSAEHVHQIFDQWGR